MRLGRDLQLKLIRESDILRTKPGGGAEKFDASSFRILYFFTALKRSRVPAPGWRRSPMTMIGAPVYLR